MDAADVEQSGTGGVRRYLSEIPDPPMVNQERSHSCQAACARQLLLDAGVAVSESELLKQIGHLDGWGTTTPDTATVLDELHPKLGYAGGAVDEKLLPILVRRGPWIASLRTGRGVVHAVIVDGLDGDVVRVRDPWGISGPGSECGTRATIHLSDFLEHWHWAMNNAVYPTRRK